jgi:ATP-binding cassette subfamily B protein
MSVNAIKEDEYIKSVSKKTTLIRLFRYMLAYKVPILAVILIMLATVAISIVNPRLIDQAIDVHIANKDIHGLIRLGLFTAALNITFVLLVKLRCILWLR